MRSPKHLWSGDWERESEALSEEMAGRPARAPVAVTPVTRAPDRASPPDRPRPADRPKAADRARTAVPSRARSRRPLPRLSLPRVSPTLIIVLGSLVILAGAGYWISRLTDSGSAPAQTTSATANQTGPIQWLGMQIEGLPPGTVVIATVAPGSQGEAAGLDPGDEVLSVNGRPINATSDIGAAISGLHPGDTVTIQVSRGSTQFSTTATLGAPPSSHP
jgi:membrane-associated protease RseP (regulator of RpoE activity)